MKKVCMTVMAVLAFGFILSGCQKSKKSHSVVPHPKLTSTIMGGNSYRKAYEIAFTGSSNYTWGAAAVAPAIRSVEMTFSNGVTNANTFTLSYTRHGITRDLYSVTGTVHTVLWFLPNDFYVIEGDVWTFSNSANSPAWLTINADLQ